jgi:phage terminase large subunit-like protein
VQWKKANPALDVFSDREDLAAQIRKAKRLPAKEPKVRNLLLNQRIAPVSQWISRVEWNAFMGDAEISDHEQVYLELDLSSTTDLTALVMVAAEDRARIQSYF